MSESAYMHIRTRTYAWVYIHRQVVIRALGDVRLSFVVEGFVLL